MGSYFSSRCTHVETEKCGHKVTRSWFGKEKTGYLMYEITHEAWYWLKHRDKSLSICRFSILGQLSRHPFRLTYLHRLIFHFQTKGSKWLYKYVTTCHIYDAIFAYLNGTNNPHVQYVPGSFPWSHPFYILCTLYAHLFLCTFASLFKHFMVSV